MGCDNQIKVHEISSVARISQIHEVKERLSSPASFTTPHACEKMGVESQEDGSHRDEMYRYDI